MCLHTLIQDVHSHHSNRSRVLRFGGAGAPIAEPWPRDPLKNRIYLNFASSFWLRLDPLHWRLKASSLETCDHPPIDGIVFAFARSPMQGRVVAFAGAIALQTVGYALPDRLAFEPSTVQEAIVFSASRFTGKQSNYPHLQSSTLFECNRTKFRSLCCHHWDTCPNILDSDSETC